MNNKSLRRREVKAEREAQGLCVYCGKIPFIKGKKGCQSCLTKKIVVTNKHVKSDNYERTKAYNFKIRLEVLEKYGNVCKCCGESNVAFLTIDHVNKDGGEERKALYGSQSGSSGAWCLKLKREPVREDLQILCYNCNMASFRFGTCPHKEDCVLPNLKLLEVDNRAKGNFNLNTKIEWLPDEELVELVRQSNCSQVARELGVDHTAVRSRLKRRGLYPVK